MRKKRILQDAFGLSHAVVEGVDFDEVAGAMVVAVRPAAEARGRCGRCARRSPGYDHGEGRRRWRALDLGTTKVFLEGPAPRVRCRDHGVTVASVPWARHGAGHTRDFDDQAAWLAVHVSKSAVVQLLRVAWRTVGAIVERVGHDIDQRVDRLEGLTRIGVDEISYKRGHRYLFVVVDHDTGRLVWASPGKDEASVNRFFDDLGPERAARLTHISADMAPWITKVVKARAPGATRCADKFHVVQWAVRALDVERRRAWNAAQGRKVFDQAARTGGHASSGHAHRLFAARHALWKNPEHLSERQRQQLSFVEASDPRLWRAYLLKEGLRTALSLPGDDGREALDDWVSWARRSRIKSFVVLQRRITDHRHEIDAARDSGLSNALVESTNTKIRLFTRIAYGFHGPQPLIALALLSLGGHCPSLPGRK